MEFRSGILLMGSSSNSCQQALPLLRGAARHAWHRRWPGILAVAAQCALAATLKGDDPWLLTGRDGFTRLWMLSWSARRLLPLRCADLRVLRRAPLHTKEKSNSHRADGRATKNNK
jgi:hypothetical protein